MNKTAIIDLEKLIFDAKKKPAVAAHIIADIIGVAIGIKPAMVGYFDIGEISALDYEKLTTLLQGLGLKALFFSHTMIGNSGLETDEDMYVSTASEKAAEAHAAFEELWQTMDDFGQIYNPEKWEVTTKRIGKLMGYPETAIKEFVNPSNSDAESDEERTARMRRNRYYAHSAEHEEEEYQAYDLKINQAIAELAPMTTKLFVAEKGKRWL